MIITLCGSARFEPWFHMWNRALGLAGHCVFGLTSYPSQNEGGKDWYTPEQKVALDKVHLNKIKASDAILVLNCFAYLGESTLNEIEFAKKKKKKIYMLESWGFGYGIAGNHTSAWQRAARFYGVPKGYGSPINAVCTNENGFRDTWSTLLLGEGGSYRSSIVDMLKQAESAALNVPSISPEGTVHIQPLTRLR